MVNESLLHKKVPFFFSKHVQGKKGIKRELFSIF